MHYDANTIQEATEANAYILTPKKQLRHSLCVISSIRLRLHLFQIDWHTPVITLTKRLKTKDFENFHYRIHKDELVGLDPSLRVIFKC